MITHKERRPVSNKTTVETMKMMMTMSVMVIVLCVPSEAFVVPKQRSTTLVPVVGTTTTTTSTGTCKISTTATTAAIMNSQFCWNNHKNGLKSTMLPKTTMDEDDEHYHKLRKRDMFQRDM